MKALVLEKMGSPMMVKELPTPSPTQGEVLIKVKACGVCRTDIHILDDELPTPKLPLILGHQVVGIIEKCGSKCKRFQKGDLVGVPWLGKSCGHCFYCKNEKENLCNEPLFTGYQINGGFAEFCVAHEPFIFPIPKEYSEVQATPLLCAGMIGYRSLKMTGYSKKIGFYGFGAAAHLLIQVANFQNRKVYAFTRKGDIKTQEHAKELGAVWAGDSKTSAPELLDAAIIFAPIGSLIPTALKAVRKGGNVVCAGIHMSDIPSFSYEILWNERTIRSVANLTRKDGEEFLELAPKIPIKTEVKTYPIEKGNEAINDLRKGKLTGSAVIIP